MAPKVFIVHGWDGSPQDCWLPWLKSKLEEEGIIVQSLSMPHPENPTIADWVNQLADAVVDPDKDTYFVGHSIGCQAILRYVEQLPKPIGGIVCVAGWFRLPYLSTDEEKEIAHPWLETLMDFDRIKQRAGKIIAIFSDNDPDVDLGDKELFEKNLNAKTIVEHEKGHFSDDAGVTDLPSALVAVKELIENN
ncbi:MAG: alpha/beta fold hydrolase [Patescibacteria group bacterium]|jgi:hypothetical protein